MARLTRPEPCSTSAKEFGVNEHRESAADLMAMPLEQLGGQSPEPRECRTRITEEDGAPCGEPASFVGNTQEGGSAYVCPNGHKTFVWSLGNGPFDEPVTLADHLAAGPEICRCGHDRTKHYRDGSEQGGGCDDAAIGDAPARCRCKGFTEAPSTLAGHLAAGIDAILGG